MSGEFIGREDECQLLGTLLTRHPIVTLVGPGGIGKTRLAGEVSRVAGDGFPGGVLVSELSGVDVDDDLEPVVARQLGYDSLDAVRVQAVGSPTLVVLDNCESALAQASAVAGVLADAASDIVVLATSRAPLQAPGERVVTLDALTLPEADEPDAIREAAAARLFMERAEAAGASWSFDDANLVAIGRLVRQLDGLPLAIELAAARSRVLAPPELVRLLDQQLDLLARPGAAGDRHHSLRTAILASYQPLTPSQQGFLRRLSVMSAPFDLTLAHRVAGESPIEIDTVDALTELVDASLVAVRPGPGGATEYRLLDSIRAFGRERLTAAGEDEQAADRYVEAMLVFADEIMADALSAFTPELLGRIRDRFVHLATTIAWCVDHDETGDRAYRLFIPFYGPTGARTEVAELARRVRARWDTPAPLQAEAYAVMGTAVFLSGETAEGAALSREAIEHPEATSLARIVGHRVLGYAASVEDRLDDAREALATAVELAVPFSESFARELKISWAGVTADPDDGAEALAVLVGVEAEAARQGEKLNVAWAAVVQAYHHCLRGDVASARRAAEKAMAVAGRTGFPWSLGSAHRTMGAVLALDDGWAAAAPHFRSAVDVTVSVGDLEGAAITLRSAAAAARHGGDHELAVRLWALVPPLRARSVVRSILIDQEQELAGELGPPGGLDVTEDIVLARQLLGPAVGAADAGPVVTPAAAGASDGDGSGPSADRAAAEMIRFDDCELDLALHELRRRGERVHVEPQVFDVLAHLAKRHGALVTKEELLDAVWGDRFVSESALSSRIKAARQATGDDGRTQRVIRTVHGRGFTFVADIVDG
ncbi:MAG: winged helix-turn-helix domain-containing protein [Actinomycetota bacterium]